MSRETVARAACQNCGGDMAVKTNVAGKAYYSCDHCGFKGQHTWQRSSDAYLAKVQPKAPANPEPQPGPVIHKPAPARSAGTVLG